MTQHCDPTLVGSPVAVTETACQLAFGAPFNQFSATLAPDGQLSVSGPQTCTGTGSATSIAMTCTPGTCTVTLTR